MIELKPEIKDGKATAIMLHTNYPGGWNFEGILASPEDVAAALDKGMVFKARRNMGYKLESDMGNDPTHFTYIKPDAVSCFTVGWHEFERGGEINVK